MLHVTISDPPSSFSSSSLPGMNVIMGPIYIDRIERMEPPSARRQRVCFTVDKAEKHDSPMSYCLGYGLETSGSHPRRQVGCDAKVVCACYMCRAASFPALWPPPPPPALPLRELEMLWRHFGFVRARKRSMHNVRGGCVTRVFPQ